MNRESLWQIIIHFIYCITIAVPFGYYGICWLLDIKFRIKEMFIIMLPITIYTTLTDILYPLYAGKLNTTVTILILCYLETFLNLVCIYSVHRTSIKKLFIAISVETFISLGIIYILQPTLLSRLFPEGYYTAHRLLIISILQFVAMPISLIVIYIILKKMHFNVILNACQYDKKSTNHMVAICFILPAIIFNIVGIDSFCRDFLGISLPIVSILLLCLVIIYYLGVKGVDRDKMRALETTAKQQLLYVQELEKMQIEMRDYQHNFKNMLSGIYLQARDGQMEAISDYLQKAALNFDIKIGFNIKQAAQLSNIQIIELKSLLYTKFITMNEKSIPCIFEALYPVKSVCADLDDLIVCVGILLDNAIEESEKCNEPELSVIITKLETCLSVVVINKLSGPVNCHEIDQYGFSTKGENRGVGLFSYKKIVNKYRNMITATKCSNACFTQELMIMDV